jgi:hypothetical protein
MLTEHLLVEGDQMSEDASDTRTDIWPLLEARARQASQAPGAKSRNGFSRPRFPNDPLGLDILSTLWWAYLLGILFAPGTDALLHRTLGQLFGQGIPLRFVTPILVLIVSAIFWRKHFVKALAYIAFFPLVVLIWKLPKRLFFLNVHRSWPAMMMIANAIVSLWRNIRYHVLSKGLGILAAILVLRSTSPSVLAVAATAIFLLLLVTSCCNRSRGLSNVQNKPVRSLATEGAR